MMFLKDTVKKRNNQIFPILKKEQHRNYFTMKGSLTNKIEIIERGFFQTFISSILKIYKK